MATTYLNFAGAAMRLSASPNAWQQTTAAGQTLTGLTGKDNQLSDALGGATLIGGGDDDTFLISLTDTTIVEPAGSGVDTVIAWCSFALPSNVTDLYLESKYDTGTANGLGDLIIAKGGSDILVGGAGNDVLVDAGAGGDLFSLSQAGGNDVIYGFQTSGVGQDFIRLTNFGFTSFAEIQAHMRQVGADAVLSLSATNSLAIRGVNLASLTASDFLLQLNTSQLKMTFNGEFKSLSLYNAATGQGIWKTNYDSGYQGESGPQAYTSRTLTSNGEQELYVDPSYQGTATTALGLNPFSVSNGILTITASKAPSADVAALGGYQYTSGLLTTAKSFSQLYGYFEMKAELPTGQGVWPAFWLLPTDGSWPPELDALESIGGNTVYQTEHTDSTGKPTYISAATTLSNVANTYHTYGVLWTATSIEFFIDHVEVNSIPTPSDMHTPMYMLANLAIGGYWPGDAPTTFTSAQMKIAYIRAYSLGGSPLQPTHIIAGVGATAADPDTLSGARGRGADIERAAPTGRAAHAVLLFGQCAAGQMTRPAAATGLGLADQAMSASAPWRSLVFRHE
jgi:serralysin